MLFVVSVVIEVLVEGLVYKFSFAMLKRFIGSKLMRSEKL